MARKKKGRDLHGLLVLDKPLGLSSNHALQRVKQLFNAKKAGHTGTLDPLATGVLVLCFGRATKIVEHVMGLQKSYRVVAKLGEQTVTADSEGEIIKTEQVTTEHLQEFANTALQFVGEIEQLPPMYSALKKDGVPLYKIARAGKEVEREPRKVRIYSIEIESVEYDLATMTVHCSKGTYIRTLVEDIGTKLGCGAHVKELRRRSVGEFGLNYPMHTMEQLEQLADNNDLSERLLLPIEAAFMCYPKVEIKEGLIQLVELGKKIKLPCSQEDEFVRIYDTNQSFRGLAQVNHGRLEQFSRFCYN